MIDCNTGVTIPAIPWISCRGGTTTMGARLIILVFVLVLTGCYKLSKLKQGSDYDELFMASRDNFEEVVEILDDHPLMVEIYDYMKPERVKNASQFSERDWIAFRRIRHLMPLMEVGSVTSQRNAKGISFRMSLPFMNHSRLDRINYREGAKDV